MTTRVGGMLALILRILLLVGLHVPPDHVAAAMAAETEDVPAEVLLAVAAVESDYDPAWVSRVESGSRVIGRIPGDAKPEGITGPLFCGPLQTQAKWSWRTCLEQRQLAVGYSLGSAELTEWFGRAHGELRAALRGYACGNAGLTGPCRNYGHRVLARARRLGWRPVVARS